MDNNSDYGNQIVRLYKTQNDAQREGFIVNTITTESVESIDELGTLICALSNYAAYVGIPYAYAIMGMDKNGVPVKSTELNSSFFAEAEKMLSLKLKYSLFEAKYEDFDLVVIEAQSAFGTSAQFNGTEYILDESYKPVKLAEAQREAQELWVKLRNSNSFEMQPAMNNVSAEDVMNLLDCYKLAKLLPDGSRQKTAHPISTLIELRFIEEKNTGKYVITNLGALLLAKRLSFFPTITHKAVRVIRYMGKDVSSEAREQVGGKGYIVGFEGLIQYITALIPTVGKIEGAIRKEESYYPDYVIRELVANALIHQDLNANGAPIVSIFADRLEITNPGEPLIKYDRFIDHPPVSRNEALATAMRKLGICEERGSGYDKVIKYVEEKNLPAPTILSYGDWAKVSLYFKSGFDSFTKEERINACYAHVCLNYVAGKASNNSSLRMRFQLPESKMYVVSRVFKAACDEGLILALEGTGMKNREYIPYWAKH
ncbi:MAG: transcriptional regulator [Clostridia bacterium]|nr:transcriptional regulator [Clostridia bacterium]